MSNETTGGADTPLPPAGDDPDTVQLRRPLWEEWTPTEQDKAAAAITAAAADDAAAADIIAANRLTTAEGGNTTSGEAAALEPEEPDLAAAGVLANGETVTAEDLDGMPWYEARVEVYVRNGPPGDEYGVGGDKIAHVRAATQAPTFVDASERLDAELAAKWQALLLAAPLADQAPTPDPEPTPDPRSINPDGIEFSGVGLLIGVVLALVIILAVLAFT